MTLAARLRTIANELRPTHPAQAALISGIAVEVGRLEKTMDEIVQDAMEDACALDDLTDVAEADLRGRQ